MTQLSNGKYLTHPTYGPKSATREVTVFNGMVSLPDTKYQFTVSDFFSVNTMVKAV